MKHFYESIIKSEPYQFFLNPDFEPVPISFREKVQNMNIAFKFEFKVLLVFFVLIFLDGFCSHFFKATPFFSKAFSRFHFFKSMPIKEIFLFTVVFAQIIEELAFRAFMNYKKSLVVISFTALGYSFLRIFFKEYFEWWIFAIISLVVLGISSLLINQQTINRITFKQKRIFLYFSCVIFALLHINNYQLDNLSVEIFFILLFAVLPQFISSISLSYLRVKNGLGWSILYHAIFNFISIIPLLFREGA